jgi:hypothetical protein
LAILFLTLPYQHDNSALAPPAQLFPPVLFITGNSQQPRKSDNKPFIVVGPSPTNWYEVLIVIATFSLLAVE